MLAPETRRGLLWKLALLAVGVPLALLANALRAAILGVGVETWGAGFVREGVWHEVVGWGTWGCAVVALMAAAVLVARWRPVN